MPRKNDNWLTLQLAPKCAACVYATHCPFACPLQSLIFPNEVHYCPKEEAVQPRRFFLSFERLRKLERVHLN